MYNCYIYQIKRIKVSYTINVSSKCMSYIQSIPSRRSCKLIKILIFKAWSLSFCWRDICKFYQHNSISGHYSTDKFIMSTSLSKISNASEQERYCGSYQYIIWRVLQKQVCRTCISHRLPGKAVAYLCSTYLLLTHTSSHMMIYCPGKDNLGIRPDFV